MLDLLAFKSTSLVVQVPRSAPERLVVTPLVQHLQAIGPHPEDGPVDQTHWGFVLKIANPTTRSIAIEQIDVRWRGTRGLRARNRADRTQASHGAEFVDRGPGERSLPLIVPPASASLVVVSTTMCMYRSRLPATCSTLARYTADELHPRLRHIDLAVGTSLGPVRSTIDARRTFLLYVGRTIKIPAA